MNETAVIPYSGISQMLAKDDLQAMVNRAKEVYRSMMQEDVHYGTIPGTSKATLLKPGAELLNALYGYRIGTLEFIERTEQWDVPASSEERYPLFRYLVRVTLVNRHGEVVGQGVGECNSYEAKYRYRNASRTCPKCGKATIIKGRAEFGGGWVCFKSKGGCGAKFLDGDAQIEKQKVGRVANPDIYDQVNTIMKMAKKRAYIDATLSATGTSEFFTQDVEDMNAPAPPAKVPAEGAHEPGGAEAPEEAAFETVQDRANAPSQAASDARPPAQSSRPKHADYAMPMGPNKGRRLAEIDSETLRKAAAWCKAKQKFLDVAEKIDAYLASLPSDSPITATNFDALKEEIEHAQTGSRLHKLNDHVNRLASEGVLTDEEQDTLTAVFSARWNALPPSVRAA